MKHILILMFLLTASLTGCASPHVYRVYEIHRTALDTGTDLTIHIRVDVTAGTSCSLDAGTYVAWVNGRFLDACE